MADRIVYRRTRGSSKAVSWDWRRFQHKRSLASSGLIRITRPARFLSITSALRCEIMVELQIPQNPARTQGRSRRRRDGRFRLSEAGIKSIVAAVEAHRNPAAAWPLWFGVAVLVVGALAALSFIRRSEDPHHSHLK